MKATAIHGPCVVLDLSKVQHDYNGKELTIEIPAMHFDGQFFTPEAKAMLSEVLGKRRAEMEMECAQQQLWDAQVSKFLSELQK